MNTRPLFISTFCCIDQPLDQETRELLAADQSISYLSSIMNGEV